MRVGLTSLFRRAAAASAVAAALPLLALLLQGQDVFAHAHVVRSEPAPGSTLVDAPDRVVIWFTEPLEPSFSEIQTLDSTGARVDNGDSAVDSSDTTVMSVSLGALADGTYTVGWKNVSTVDGHRARGSFVFSVGEASGGAAASLVVEEGLFQSPVEPVVRWLALLGALVAAGGAIFNLAVGTVARRSESPRRLRRLWTRSSLRLSAAALGVFALASAAHLVVQTSVIYEQPLGQAIGGAMVSVVMETDWGRLWLWRAGLIAVAAVVMYAQARAARSSEGGRRRNAEARLMLLSLCLWAGILATLSLTSHAAATTAIRAQAVPNDLLHLWAAAVWVGGLAHLLLLVAVTRQLAGPQRRRTLASVVPRFSLLAGLSLATLVVTGIYGAWAQVTVVEALATPYGRALLAKVAVVGGLVMLGAVNLLWVRPRLSWDDAAGRWLRRLVGVEVAAAALVILAVGFLTALEPARQVASRQGLGQPDSIVFRETVEGTGITLDVEPGEVGSNRFTVLLEDRLGAPIENASEVSVRISYLDSDLGEQVLSASPLGGGVYVVNEARFSIAGPWQAELAVRRPDAFDARTAFRFEVTAGASGSGRIAPSPETGLALLGGSLAALGVVFLAAGMPLGGMFTLRGASVMAPGVVGLLVGAALLFNGVLGGGTTGPTRNPFAPNTESLEIGGRVYYETCMTCHGVAGRGDGPGAAALESPPADLAVHVPLHSDADLFGFVSEGIAGTAMPAFGDRLTDDEIWHVVNYIKTFDE